MIDKKTIVIIILSLIIIIGVIYFGYITSYNNGFKNGQLNYNFAILTSLSNRGYATLSINQTHSVNVGVIQP